MTKYIFRGTASLRGVDFFIEADSLEEAKKIATKGMFDDCEYHCAELYDWEINIESGEANE